MTDGGRRLPGPWRSLGLAVLFVLAWAAVQVVAIVILIVAVAPPGWPHGGIWPIPRPPSWLVVAASLVSGQLCFLAAAWWRGGRESGGDHGAGLGWAPVRHRMLLLLSIPATEAAVVAWLLAMRRVVSTGGERALAALAQGAPGNALLRLLVLTALLALLPAFCEELFFRGWLWGALRRHWRPFPTAVVTSGFFLLLHAADGLTRPVLLLPLGIALAAVRHWCGSVKASVALHLTNNLLVTTAVWWALLR